LVGKHQGLHRKVSDATEWSAGAARAGARPVEGAQGCARTASIIEAVRCAACARFGS
jgi:hypothetical protein